MTTKEQDIQDYLISHNYIAEPQEFISKFLNCNYEIQDIIYDFDTNMITIITQNTEFTFEWNINHNILQ